MIHQLSHVRQASQAFTLEQPNQSKSYRLCCLASSLHLPTMTAAVAQSTCAKGRPTPKAARHEKLSTLTSTVTMAAMEEL